MSADNANAALAAARELHSSFAGKSPTMQGAMLAELVSTWIAGHRPEIRREVTGNWLRCVRDLIALSDATHGPGA